jgi:hypothetical protein
VVPPRIDTRASQPGNHPAPWKLPGGTYGYAEAVTTAGTLAAPVLAGFAITMIVFVIQAGGDSRAPGVALALLAAAVVALVGSVQAAFIARMYLVRPSELLEWWPDHAEEARMAALRREQTKLSVQYEWWANTFRRSFNVGLLLLIAAVAVVIMPAAHSHHQVARWVGCAILAAGFCGELAWVVGYWAGQLGPPWWKAKDGD